MSPQAITGMTTGASVMLFFGTIWLLVGFFLAGPRRKCAWWLFLVALALASFTGPIWVRVSRIAHRSPPTSVEEVALTAKSAAASDGSTGSKFGAIFLAVALLNFAHRSDYNCLW